jgi:hypothetical protein
MLIIAVFGGLVLVGAVFAVLKNISNSSEKGHNRLNII